MEMDAIRLSEKINFYEPFEDYEDDENWSGLLKRAVDTRWDVQKKGVWMYADIRDADLPDQGFKIHISPDMDRLTEQVSKVIDFLVSEQVSFKVLRDANLVLKTVSKTFSRTASGKLFTIYPDSDATFLKLCELLKTLLEDFRGPYILTDRPVPGSSVIFYRYGAFLSVTELGGGERVHHLLRDHDGQLVLDRREPGRATPEWITDPFPPSAAPKPKGSRLLKGRYTVKRALAFSNRGGVYQALDAETGEPVVIKEARLRTGYVPNYGYADSFLKREFEVLKEIEESRFSIRAIDFFKEGGHSFLVEEYVPDSTLHSLYASPSTTLLPFLRGRTASLAQLRKLLPVFVNAIEGVSRVHLAGYSIGDVSPKNLLVNLDSGRVTLIDVESCIKVTGVALPGYHPSAMRTPGFTPPKANTSINAFESDWYILAKCFAHGSIGLQAIPDLGGMDDRAILRRFCSLAALPKSFESIILKLMEGDWRSALDACRVLIEDLNGRTSASSVSHSIHLRRPVEEESDGFMSPDRMASKIANGLLRDYQGQQKSTLWPGSSEGTQYSKWCFIYGAAGVVYSLQLRETPLPEGVLDGLRQFSAEPKFNPSLFYGRAGIAMTLNALSLKNDAESILESSDPALLAGATGIASGLAGLGLALVSYWESNRSKDSILTKACEIGLRLVALGSRGDKEETYWTIDGRTNDVYYGYQHGVTGIAYFFGRLAAATGEKRFLKVSREATHFVLNRCRIDDYGRPNWGVHKDHPFSYPYLGDGACGIGATFLRLGYLHDDNRLVDEAKLIADAAFSSLAVNSGVIRGLTGIGMLMQDMRDFTGDLKYAWLARSIEKSLQTYCVGDAEARFARFPGTLNMWLCCDYGTGAAGVLDFYTRQTSKLGNFIFDLGSDTP